jgi:hypothetical protein
MCIRDWTTSGRDDRTRRRGGSGRGKGSIGRGRGHEFERIRGTEGLDLGETRLGSSGRLEKVLGDDGDGCWTGRDNSGLQVRRRRLECHVSCFIVPLNAEKRNVGYDAKSREN